MELIATNGRGDIATVFVARTDNGKLLEFVESFEPSIPIHKKWVTILSVMHGCPVGCLMCDAGRNFGGNLSKDDMLAQVDYVVERRFPDRRIPTEKWKIQFARMGEPSFNNAVLEVLEALPHRYDAPGLIPSISTIAPAGRDKFFELLLKLKNRYYSGARFQLQFSIHTTDFEKRNMLIPSKKLSLEKIGKYSNNFFEDGDRKITLNFAMIKGYPIDPEIIDQHFSPEKVLIKITPLNPTEKAHANQLASALDPENEESIQDLVNRFRLFDFDVIVSIGNLQENQIRSNCGQYVDATGKIS
ncbi:MAG: radical SAM protein [Candidatus Bathyarchaeia archaeon]